MLPSILANCFKDSRFFAVSHAPNATTYFQEGKCYSPELHPVFNLLCKLFNDVYHSDMEMSRKRDFLIIWFNTMMTQVYSAPTLSFMFTACSLPLNSTDNCCDELRILDSHELQKFRTICYSHMTSSETEFKFLFGYSLIRLLSTLVDMSTVSCFELLRFIESITSNLGTSICYFLTKKLFESIVARHEISLEEQFDAIMNRVSTQTDFHKEESASIVNFIQVLLVLANDNAVKEKLLEGLKTFISSIVGKLSTNPYIAKNRILFALDLLLSSFERTTLHEEMVEKYRKEYLELNVEDIAVFFGNNTFDQNGLTYIWRKWVAVLERTTFDKEETVAIGKLTCKLLENYLKGDEMAGPHAAELIADFTGRFNDEVKAELEPLLNKSLEHFEKANSNFEIFVIRQCLMEAPFNKPMTSTILTKDLNRISDHADVMGTSAQTMLCVLNYFSRILVCLFIDINFSLLFK